MSFEPSALRARFRARRHTALLCAIVAAFAVRPLIGDGPVATAVFSIAMLLLLLVALLNIQVDDLLGEREALLAQKRRRIVVGGVLALLAAVERLAILVAPTHRFYLIGSLGWLLFFAFVTWCQLHNVLKQREVTGETISNAVAIYLLLAVTWGIMYVLLFQLQPGAFNFAASPAPPKQDAFAVFVYFSMTTLSTVGFGDIVPLSMQARYVAVAEGVVGQFYLTILVARLVAMRMSQSDRQTAQR